MAAGAFAAGVVGEVVKDPAAINNWIQSLTRGTGSHNYTKGAVGPNDVILYTEDVRKASVAFGNATQRFYYRAAPNETITCVAMIDRWDDDTGGDAEWKSGGPNCDHVEFLVTSRWFRGFHFKMIVYGQRR